MAHAIEELLVKRVTNKKVFRFGSFGWVGGEQKDFEAKTEKSGWDILGHHEWQGAPTDADKAAIKQALEAYCDTLIAFTDRT